MKRPFRGRRPRAGKSMSAERRPDALDVEMLDTQLEMASALTFAVELKEEQLHVVRHSARVAMLATWLAGELGVEGDDFYEVQYAARLHEVGMISVPSELVRKRAPLAPEELERVRGQARVGAEVARTLRRPLAALLIEHQYDDYAALERSYPRGSDAFLLMGIFRVADVLDAMTSPRPYQQPVPEPRRLEVLREGAGTRFHPDAVQTLLRAWDAPG